MVNSFHVTWNRTVNDRPMPFYFSPADLGANVYSPQPGYMGVSVTNGFNIGTGGTNPGYFNSDSLQIANDVDVLLGRHQLSFGGNWIRTKIETVNNRPTNGQFTFNGQSTGLGLADFMLGRVSNFVQGNPVFDFDENDYVGAYVQDEWKLRQNLTLNVGVRWEPYLPIKNSLDYVSNFDEARFDAGIRSTVYPQAPAGLLFPGDDGFPGSAAMKNKLNQFAPRAGLVWQLNEQTALRGGWGRFYDTPHLFFNTRFANNPPWGAQITLTSPPGGFTDPYATYPGGNPFPALATGWMDQPFPTAGVYVNAPLDTRPTTLQQWNLGAQRQIADWLVTASYLGNHSSHLWRATELNYAVFTPGATTATTNARRRLVLKNPAQGAFYGTIGQLDDTGRATYHGMLLSAQRRLKGGLSALVNYTLSKCKSDPATTEITGPTITDPTNPDLDYSYCDSDRRHVLNVSLVARAPSFSNAVRECGSGRLAGRAAGAVAERQPVLGDDRRGQRAVRHGRAESGAGAGRRLWRSHREQLSESRRVHLAGGRHLQRAQTERVRRAVAASERSGGEQDVQGGGADPAIPLGGVQRAEPRELQQPGLGVEQHELRPDPDGVRSENHAVRVQVRLLGRHPGWRRPVVAPGRP